MKDDVLNGRNLDEFIDDDAESVAADNVDIEVGGDVAGSAHGGFNAR